MYLDGQTHSLQTLEVACGRCPAYSMLRKWVRLRQPITKFFFRFYVFWLCLQGLTLSQSRSGSVLFKVWRNDNGYSGTSNTICHCV